MLPHVLFMSFFLSPIKTKSVCMCKKTRRFMAVFFKKAICEWKTAKTAHPNRTTNLNKAAICLRKQNRTLHQLSSHSWQTSGITCAQCLKFKVVNCREITAKCALLTTALNHNEIPSVFRCEKFHHSKIHADKNNKYFFNVNTVRRFPFPEAEGRMLNINLSTRSVKLAVRCYWRNKKSQVQVWTSKRCLVPLLHRISPRYKWSTRFPDQVRCLLIRVEFTHCHAIAMLRGWKWAMLKNITGVFVGRSQPSTSVHSIGVAAVAKWAGVS